MSHKTIRNTAPQKFKIFLEGHWWISGKPLFEKCTYTELFLVCILPYSVRIGEKTDQKKCHIWTLFPQWAEEAGRGTIVIPRN